MPHVLFT